MRWASFNDALDIAHYRPSPIIYHGEKRRGILESPPKLRGANAFLVTALGADFILSAPIPLHRDMEEALHFTFHDGDFGD